MRDSALATGTERIAQAFAGHRKRAALMPYLMGAFPDAAESHACAEAAIDSGADLIELGVPFSDPLADGPLIHAAAVDALAGGAIPEAVLELCRAVGGRVPVILMVYANVVLAGGDDKFVGRAAEAGAAGLIVPDLPHEEASGLRQACDRQELALVPLVAPTSSPERVAEIGAEARGFVYTVSLSGTTGERATLPEGLADTVGRVRAATELPVAVGFGIASAEQARSVGELADGVIVGSRMVRAAREGGARAVADAVGELASALAL